MTRYYMWCDNNKCRVFFTLWNQKIHFEIFFREELWKGSPALNFYQTMMTPCLIAGFFLSYFYRDRNTFSRMGYPILQTYQNDPNWFTHLDQSEINKHTQLSQPFSDHFLKTSSIHELVLPKTPWYENTFRIIGALWAESSCSLMPAWTSSLTNSRVTSNLRRHKVHV